MKAKCHDLGEEKGLISARALHVSSPECSGIVKPAKLVLPKGSSTGRLLDVRKKEGTRMLYLITGWVRYLDSM